MTIVTCTNQSAPTILVMEICLIDISVCQNQLQHFEVLGNTSFVKQILLLVCTKELENQINHILLIDIVGFILIIDPSL